MEQRQYGSEEGKALLKSGNIAKAGLPSSKDAINSVIESATTARYAQYQTRRTANTQARVASIRQKLASIRDWKPIEREVDAKMAALRTEADAGRDPSILWVHLDMDAFFASVECRDAPELAGIPMAVGGMSMLSTSNYMARKFGVVSAMPGYIALRLCPQLKIIPHSFDKYKKASKQVAGIIEEMTGQMDAMLSIDEATFWIPNDDTAEAKVLSIRSRIKEITCLTCTCGIAPTPALAKLSSNVKKPDGQFRLPAGDAEWLAFYRALLVHKINGIGKVTATVLQDALQVSTIEDLYNARYRMYASFTRKQAEFLLCVSIGIQGLILDPDADDSRKSLGIERTFEEHPNLQAERPAILAIFKELSTALADDLASKGLYAHTIGIKWKSVDFEVSTRAKTLTHAVDTADEIMRVVEQILDKCNEDEYVRLLGVRASGLCDAPSNQQVLAFKPAERATEKVNLECPVCGKMLTRLSLDDPRIEHIINVHLDRCL